ncbi:retrovirus-related pol polyprotein from transposon TNT 1-94 [Tanacetum coccineum]
MEIVHGKDYILVPLWTNDPPFSQSSKSSQDDGSKPLNNDQKKVDEDPRKDSESIDQEKDDNVNNTNNVNAASTNKVNIVVSPIPTTSIHKDHPLDQVIGDLQSAPQTRRMSKNLKHMGLKNLKRNKKDERGIVIKNKARLVTQRYTQEEGIDYDEVFDPIARIEAIRLFLAYASFKYFMVYQMDVKSAFLYGKIKDEVYVCQPPGFEDPDFLDRVYKKELCNAFEKLMHEKFQMSSMGELTFFLGLQVQQKKDDEGDEEVDVHIYRSMIGSLMYLTSSRPDIMFAVCACARYQVNSKVSHLYAVKRIFRYLKGQPKLGLWYPKDSPFDLVAYTNSDYAGASLDGKSTIGGCQFLRCRLISWQCKKQIVVVYSTTEAKYVAASSCCRQSKSILTNIVENEAVHKELGDSLVRAATNASSLEAEQDSGNITKTRSKATHNESSSLGTTSGGGTRRQETMGDTISQTSFENVSKHSNDQLLARGSTLQSGEDSLKLTKLIEFCTNLQQRVLDLEKTKTTQQIKIDSLKRRVKKLEKKISSRTHKLKRLYKVSLSARVESSRDEEHLGEDASKQRRRINAIDADEDITLVNVQDDADNKMFDVNTLTGDKVLAEQEVIAKDVNLSVDEVTLAQALAALKISAAITTTAIIPTPRKGIVITDLGTPTIIRSSQQPSQEAFTASANVHAIYLQQFWKTIKALAITLVNPAHPFKLPPSGNTVIDFVNELGYPEPIEIVSNIRVNYMYQPWREILSLINQCLTGKTSGSDKPRHPVLQMLWGIVTQTNVDHAELIWEEFTQGIQTFFSHKASHKASLKNPKKKVTPLLIPYRWFSKVIIYYLASNNNIHRRPDSAVHHTKDDYILGNLKFVPKGESVEVFGMAIPDPLITEAIQQSSYYPKYLKMVAENTKKTPQEGASMQPATKRATPKKPTTTTPVKQSKPAPPPSKKPSKRKLPQKVRKGKPAFQLVDEEDEAQQESIPQREDDDPDLELAKKLSLETPQEKGEGEGDDADLERAIKLSLDPAFLPQGRAPVGGVTIRDPVSETTSKLHEVVGKGKAVVTEEQVAHSLINLSKKKRTTDQFILGTKPKEKRVVIQELGESTTKISLQLSSQQSQDKCKGILIEPTKPMKKKDLIRLDEETALKLPDEFDEEERLAR